MLKLFDGAMGTQLQDLNIADKPCPEYASITNFDDVVNIHKKYVEAGADIIETNTFGANRLKLKSFNLENDVEKIVLSSVKAARKAAIKDVLVAGAIGPTGTLIVPLGETSFDEVCSAYEEQIKAMVLGGVDYLVIETIIDIQEMRAAVLAAKAVSNLPVISQLTFGEDGRTVTGTDVETAATILEPLGVSVIGMNCSLGPKQLLPLVEKLSSYTTLPIAVQPNAGLPALVNSKTVFPLSPNEMALWVPKLVAAGANFIGGCCGTTPEHIKEMKKALLTCSAKERINIPAGVRLASRSKTVWLGTQYKTVLIGERINPTGRKVMAQELKEDKFILVKKDALDQVEAGAQVLDINMGVPGVYQKRLMKKAVTELSSIVDVPFSIDSTDPEVIEVGLRYFPGRALINSVNGKKDNRDKILKIAKKYGAAVIVLPLGETLPILAKDKVQVAEEIIQSAKDLGLSDEDFVLDALVLTAATDGQAPNETLKTIKLYKDMFGYPTTMGLSNVSFGLPNRELINMSFFLMSIASGLDAPIINPLAKGIKEALLAASVINGQDSQGISYSEYYSQALLEQENNYPANNNEDILNRIIKTVMRGEKELASLLVQQACDEGYDANDISNNALTKAMETIGDNFALGKAFLPQVMLAAEAMKASFDVLKHNMGEGQRIKSKGKVVLATVEGDIHDLGKNIVSTLLSNSGYKIIDLGKDVSSDTILECVVKEKPNIVGLCALMTTTLGAMEKSVQELKKHGYDGLIMVGGAVVTSDYADQIGADIYAKDGVEAVKLADKYLK